MTEKNKLQKAMEYIDPNEGLINPMIEITKETGLVKAMEYIKEKKDNPESRIYIVLYLADIDEEEVKSFEVLKGRTETYEFIKNIAEYMDIHESKIVIDDVPYEESLSVYNFMIVMKNYFDDSFDIEDYNIGDIQ